MSDLSKLDSVIEGVRAWGKVIKTGVLMVAAVVGSYVTAKYAAHDEKPVMQPAAAKEESHQQLPQQSLVQPPVVAAGQPVSQPITNPGQTTVTFMVQSVGRNKSGKSFLNSLTDYRQAGNQVIVLTGPAAGANLDSYKGRTVTATGVINYYKGKPQVEVNDLNQLRVN